MKVVSLLALLVVVSCGAYTPDDTSRVGESKSTTPVTVEPTNVSRICDAIAAKAPSSLVNTQAIFSITSKGCDATAQSAPSDITTTIQLTLGGFRFVQSNGLLPYFSEIETVDQGSMSTICRQLVNTGTLASPIQNGNEFLYFSTTSITEGDCPVKADQQCIALMRASGTANGQAIVHTKEWIRFNLDATQGRIGYFTLKRQITSASCSEDKSSANSAELK